MLRVPDAVAGEQFAQRAVLDVAEAVVGLSRLATMPCWAKEASAHSTRPVTVVAFSSWSSSTYGEPRLFVDDRVRVA